MAGEDCSSTMKEWFLVFYRTKREREGKGKAMKNRGGVEAIRY
jgi:hypothetical protein